MILGYPPRDIVCHLDGNIASSASLVDGDRAEGVCYPCRWNKPGVIILPVARALNSRSIDETVVPTDYFKTSLANLVFCYRSGNLVLLRLDFTGLSVV